MDSPLRTETHVFGLIVAVEGELDIYTALQLRRQVRDLSPQRGWVIVDLRQLRFCDAAGVRTLVEAHRELMGKAVNAAMISPQDEHVRQVLKTARADRCMPMYDTVTVAEQAWARRVIEGPGQPIATPMDIPEPAGGGEPDERP